MATDPDCTEGKVIAFPGKTSKGDRTVYLVLITDDSRAEEGCLEGVYLEAVGADDDILFGQYKRATHEGDEWRVSLIDENCVDGRVADELNILDLTEADWLNCFVTKLFASECML